MKKVYSDKENNSLLSWFVISSMVTFMMLPYILTSRNLGSSLGEWVLIIGVILIIVVINDMAGGKKDISLMLNTLRSKAQNGLVIEMTILLDELDIDNKLFHIYLEYEKFSYRAIFNMEYEENETSKYLKFSFYLPNNIVSNFDEYFCDLVISQKGEEDELDIYYTFSNLQFDSLIQENLTGSLQKSIENAISIENRYDSLYLAYKNLKKVPSSVLNDLYITELDLSNNEISTIPTFLRELKYLKKINFENNYIREIPSFFEDYKYLEEVSFGHNLIKEIELNFDKMNSLTLLEINDNPKFSKIDKSFYSYGSKFRLAYTNTLLAKIISPMELIIKRRTKSKKD
jgi:hypothetical protein